MDEKREGPEDKKREMKMRWTIIGTNLSLIPFLSFL